MSRCLLRRALRSSGWVRGSDPYATIGGTTTICTGQELIDRQRALAAGAITRSEYDTLRARFLRRPH